MAQNASISSAGRATSRLGLYLVVCLGVVSSILGQEAKLLNVQSATIKDGEISLYGVIRELPTHPIFEGTILAVQVTASDSDRTTESRRNAKGAPCANCTTMHYVLLHGNNEESPEVLYRTAPGPVTYIHINKKEYMLGGVNLRWEEDKPHLKKVTLLQTGFAPPLFKRRINIRFDDSIAITSEAEKIANMALRDAFAYMRPTTLRKVFPPEGFSEVVPGSE